MVVVLDDPDQVDTFNREVKERGGELETVVAFMTDLGIPAIWAYMMDVGGRNAAAVFGWGNMWGNIGAGVSINLVPVVNSRLDSNSDWHETFTMFGIALVIAAIAAFGLNPKRTIE